MIKRLLLVCLLVFPFTNSTHAASVLPLILDEIIDTSAVAFQGICTGNRTARDPVTNFVVTYTTFEVKDVLKGNVGATHVIKQIGGIMPAGELSFRVPGVPTFAVGQEYVVFLAGVSSAGFSSPIGLSQGQFTVQQGETGKTVSNGRNFSEMAARVPIEDPEVSRPTAHKLGLEEFKQIARQRVGKLP